MTRQQYKICKAVLKYKYTNKIVEKLRSDEFETIDDIADTITQYIAYWDDTDTPNVFIIRLKDETITEVEQRNLENIRYNIPIIISIGSFVVSVIALVISVL